MGGELVGHRRARLGVGQDVASGDVDLVGEGQRPGIAGLGRGDIGPLAMTRATLVVRPEAETAPSSPGATRPPAIHKP